MRGNAVLGCSEDGKAAVIAFARGTTTAWLTLVARLRDILEVDAARTLQEISAGRGHVAQLARGAREQRLRKYGVVCANCAVSGQVAVTYRCADTDPSVRKQFDLVI